MCCVEQRSDRHHGCLSLRIGTLSERYVCLVSLSHTPFNATIHFSIAITSLILLRTRPCASAPICVLRRALLRQGSRELMLRDTLYPCAQPRLTPIGNHVGHDLRRVRVNAFPCLLSLSPHIYVSFPSVEHTHMVFDIACDRFTECFQPR